MIVSKISDQSRLSLKLKENDNGLQSSAAGWQLKMLLQPHGSTLDISRRIRTIEAMKIRTAASMPKLPIRRAIVSNLSYKTVGVASTYVFSRIIPATVFFPTATTKALPNPVLARDLANNVQSAPFL